MTQAVAGKEAGAKPVAQREPKRLRKGKAFHKIVQQDWHATAEGKISSEKSVHKPTGGRGRIDVHADAEDGDPVAVVEVKATDWDAMTDLTIRKNVSRQARQIWSYIESQLADGRTVSPGVVFSARPHDGERLLFVEVLFEEQGISVVWYDESIEERKARSEIIDAGR